MSDLVADPGSFRDAAGAVFHSHGAVYRTVTDAAVADFELLQGSGLLDALTAEGKLVSADKVDSASIGNFPDDVQFVLEHPCLPFISYPYEWSFAALKDAALLHMDVHLAALDRGLTMSDASAYNVQFVGARPVFIDTLSFRRYQTGEFWEGHRQFCEQFLNPLLLRTLAGLPHNAWYRGTLEGIAASDLKGIIPWRRRFSWKLFVHVLLHAALETPSAERRELGRDDLAGRVLPEKSFRKLLIGLRDWIAGFEPAGRNATLWRDYEAFKAYAETETDDKRAFVQRFMQSVRPATVWDIGCNTGEFALAALDAGAGYVVGWDSDQDALDIAFQRSKDAEAAFTPLYGDLANPAPSQGWAQIERPGWLERAPADAVLALAVVHHLAIGRNVPLPALVEWLVRLAPSGVVEFAAKDDPQVQRMLSLRRDVFPDYSLADFLAQLGRHAGIVETMTLDPSGRTLIWFDACRRDPAP